MSKVFGIDIDGVIADFSQSYAPFMADELEIELTADDVTSWNFYREHGVSDKEHYNTFNLFIDTGGFGNLIPVDHAIVCLRHIIQFYPTHFITHRASSQRAETEKWFKLHLPTANLRNIVYGADKGLTAKGLGVTHYVDDRFENVLEVAANGIKNVALFSQSHNMTIDTGAIARMDDWPDLMNKWGLTLDFMTPPQSI